MNDSYVGTPVSGASFGKCRTYVDEKPEYSKSILMLFGFLNSNTFLHTDDVHLQQITENDEARQGAVNWGTL